MGHKTRAVALITRSALRREDPAAGRGEKREREKMQQAPAGREAHTQKRAPRSADRWLVVGDWRALGRGRRERRSHRLRLALGRGHAPRGEGCRDARVREAASTQSFSERCRARCEPSVRCAKCPLSALSPVSPSPRNHPENPTVGPDPPVRPHRLQN